VGKRKGYFRRKRTSNLGTYLTGLRTNPSQRLTQQEVADMAGRSRNYICQIEMGKRIPSQRILRDLAIIYGVLPEEVFKEAGLLELFNLTAIIAPTEMTTGPLELLKGILPEDERQELISYLAFLRLKRRTTTQT